MQIPIHVFTYVVLEREVCLDFETEIVGFVGLLGLGMTSPMAVGHVVALHCSHLPHFVETEPAYVSFQWQASLRPAETSRDW